VSAKDYNAQLAEFARRRALAHQMRDAGTGLENIAAVLGVSKQRVSQMLAGRDRCPTCGHVRKKRSAPKRPAASVTTPAPPIVQPAPAKPRKRAPRKLTLAEIVASTVKSS
jgi:hypothetical protein